MPQTILNIFAIQLCNVIWNHQTVTRKVPGNNKKIHTNKRDAKQEEGT